MITKIYIPCIASVMIFVLIITVYFLPHMKRTLMTERKEKIKDIVTTANGIIQNNYERFKKGEITEDEAKDLSTRAIGGMSFDDANIKNYVTVTSEDHTLMAHGKGYDRKKHERGKGLPWQIFFPGVREGGQGEGRGLRGILLDRAGLQQPFGA
jgi:hypothetical protein